MKYRGTIGSDYSGKLGGVVASHNTYGTYFRRLVKPVNPKTPAQQIQRVAFGSSSQSWRTLTSSQQAAWITAAPSLPVIGKNGSIILTGQALFMYCNTLLIKAGLAPIVNPPTSTTAPAFTTPTITINGSGFIVVAFNGDAWNVPGGAVDCSISGVITAGRNYVGTYYGLATFTNPGTSNTDMVSQQSYQEGDNLQLAFVAETPDGRKTQQIIVPASVTNTTLVSGVHGLAGAGTLTFADSIAVVAGQVIGKDTSTNTILHAALTQQDTTINIAEATLAAATITEDGTVPGVKATVTPIVMT